MIKRTSEEPGDMSERLRQLERLLAPRVVAPRPPAEDALPAPRIEIERHRGRMYVAGREPHFRDITLLQPAHAARQAGAEPS